MLTETVELLKEGGIPRSLVFHSKVDVEHLICPICLNILWKPVACGQDRCFQSFCEVCIDRWITEAGEELWEAPQFQQLLQGSLYSQSLIIPPHQEEEEDYSSSEDEWPQQQLNLPVRQTANCPKCKRPFKKTSIPIIHNLLDALQLHCIHEGCKMKPTYEQFSKHVIHCPFRKVSCTGCAAVCFQSEIDKHQEQCELVLIQCLKCCLRMTRKDQIDAHSKEICIQQQFQNKDEQLKELQSRIELLSQKNEILENRIERLSKGEFELLSNFTFKTSFGSNYQFSANHQCEAKLVRASYNHQKQKNDFLHFYINSKIKTQSILGVQWRLKIHTLQGNLLLGICSTLCHYSVDYIINRLGETKKKEWNENKYKHLRKVNFTFGEGDILCFQFMPLQQCLRITNESRHLVCRFESSEILEMGESLYAFYSLEFQGDTLVFI